MSASKPALSVIISTSPGRETHLHYCLQALKSQQGPSFEVIVCDDGSGGMAAVLEPFQDDFPLLYLSRLQDGNLSRSRNLGAAQARTPYWVFVNTDVLLNPQALWYYQQYLTGFPQATLWGYIGCRKSSLTRSLWFPEVSVNWLDFRWFPLDENRWFINPDIQQAPYRLAGGHHFAMSAQVFEKIGRFNEDFQQWGDEDVEFALKGLLKGHPMYFISDVWAEHMHHGYEERFHLLAPQQQLLKSNVIIPLEIEWERRYSMEQRSAQVQFNSALWPLFHSHYLDQQPSVWQQEQKWPHLVMAASKQNDRPLLSSGA